MLIIKKWVDSSEPTQYSYNCCLSILKFFLPVACSFLRSHHRIVLIFMGNDHVVVLPLTSSRRNKVTYNNVFFQAHQPVCFTANGCLAKYFSGLLEGSR